MYSGNVYRAIKGSYNTPPGNFFVWSYLGSINATNSAVDQGTKVATVPNNTKVYKIADASNGYVKIRTLDGKVGFVPSSTITLTTERYQQTYPEKTLTQDIWSKMLSKN